MVSKVAITMDAPASGQLIKSDVNSCVATVTVENNVDPSYLTVLWLPGDKSAAWNTEYSALVMLNEKAFTDLNFTLSDSAEVTVNGETVSSENIVADVKTGLVAMLVDFSATANVQSFNPYTAAFLLCPKQFCAFLFINNLTCT